MLYTVYQLIIYFNGINTNFLENLLVIIFSGSLTILARVNDFDYQRVCNYSDFVLTAF